MTENRKNYRLDVDKIKTIKDVKNVLDNLHLIGYYDADDPNDENYYLSEYFTIPQERQGLTFSTPRKSIEELQQELDEKFENLLVKTKRKFAVSKESAEYHYNRNFDRIIENFEYARKNGRPREKFTLVMSNDSLSVNTYISSNFVIKEGGEEVGYYTFGSGYLRYCMNKKPNFIVRFCMNKLLGFKWISTK
jgi:hypothetical protein